MNAVVNPPAVEKPALPASLQRNRRLDRWLGFRADGGVEVRSGKVEIGQGILTALAQIVADGLDVEPEQVHMLAARSDASPDEGVTSGSLSVQDSGSALRTVCAEARRLHLAEAARRWQVPVEGLAVRRGVIHAADGRRIAYAELAEARLLEREVEGGPLARPAAKAVGRSLPRIDLEDKLRGRARLIHDLVLDGMLHGRVLHPPHRQAGLRRVDESALQGVVRDGRLFGVIGDSTAAAEASLARLQRAVEWDAPPPLPDEAALAAWLKSALVDTQRVAGKAGPPREVAQTIRAAYAKPFIAHASIGLCCAIARWQDDCLSVWTHSQGIVNLRRDLSLALAVDEARIVVQHVEGAGCYGHNGADDVAFDAAWLARSVPGRPVRVLWSRQDELTLAPFGPAMAIELEAGFDAAGELVAWRHQVWSNGHSGRPGRAPSPALLGAWALAEPFETPIAANVALAAGGGAERNALPSYDFPSWEVLSHRVLEMPVRSSALRALGAFGNVFAAESFIDEIAFAQGADPIAFRLRHLRDPRGRQVLERAVQRSGWRGRPREDNVGLGIGYARYKSTGAYCAVVAEVEAGAVIKVRRLSVVADIGLVINPDGAANQLEGGAIQTTSWALKEAVRFDRERITSDAWERYPVLRFSEVPMVEVELVESAADSLGAGEASIGPTAAAIANAVFNALGVRVRELPLTPERIIAAIEASS